MLDPITGTLGLLNMQSGAQSALDEYGTSQDLMALFQSRLDEIPGMRESLADYYDQQEELLGLQRANRQSELQINVGQSMFETMETGRATAGMSGFGGSGAIERSTQRGVKMLERGYQHKTQSIFDVFQTQQLNLAKEEATETAALDQLRFDIQTQMAQLDMDEPGFLTQLMSHISPFGALGFLGELL